MTIKPLADKVVVKKLQAEETTKSGIILSSGAQQKPQIAEIIAVGPGGIVDGNEIKMEVIDYLHYEGKEYALLAVIPEEELGEGEQRDAFIMEVVPVPGDDEMEEFLPVEDEALAEKLIEIFESTDFDEIFDDEEE